MGAKEGNISFNNQYVHITVTIPFFKFFYYTQHRSLFNYNSVIHFGPLP